MVNSKASWLIALALVAAVVLIWTVRYLESTGTIEIVSAEYGVPGRTCTAGPDIKKYTSEACGGFRPRCLVSVSSGWCGDPAPGVVKTLTVEYSVRDHAETRVGNRTHRAGALLSVEERRVSPRAGR